MIMIDKIFNLELNHIGIIIDPKEMVNFKEKFLFDPIQKVHVLFKFSKIKNCYIEYITREGRANNYLLGFNHLCFNLENENHLSIIHKFIIENDLGIRLTLPEKSIAKKCNIVTFYNLKFFNNIEFNLIKSDKDYI